MANRIVYGLSHSSNGWPMVDTGSCTWAKVPGAEHVSLQIQNGQPFQILRAWAADWNAYIEPLRDADSACWTATNSVPSSNHLSGTACDLNWQSHPFRVKDAGFNAAQIATMREMLAFYEGTVFWGNDWADPKDAMHVQLGSRANGGNIDTYGNPHTQDFINRKIRPDGFSTFKRGGSGGHMPLSKKDGYALAAINEGKRLGITPKGQKIAITTQLVETNLTMYANRNVPASLNYPHDAVGADHDSTGLFQQRQAWGPLSFTMDPTLSARLFYLGGQAGQRGLTDFDYNSNARTPGGWAQAVQVSAYPDRYDERFAEAERIYNRLSTIEQDDELADPAIIKKINELHAALLSPKESRSIYANPAEGARWPWYELLENGDKFNHERYVEEEARAGNLAELARVVRTAQGQGKYKDPVVVQKAQRVLAEIEATNPEILQRYLAQRGTL